MRNITKLYLIPFLVFSLILSEKAEGQEIIVKIGERKSIQSEILHETRNIIVHLPDSYNESKSYPVLYRLDGNTELLVETIATVNRIVYTDEIAPEMIIVAVENTSRARDMWPVNNSYYPKPNKAGAADFLRFIEQELIPYVDNKYPTDNYRILSGQSLSGIFVIYSFLTKPDLFNAYIASSAGFPGCEHYFTDLSNKAFEQPVNYTGLKLFITDGLLDPLDAEGTIHKQLTDFSNTVDKKLGDRVYNKHLTYENEGHVPFHSLYDGLKFIF
ncbi:MAG TPA: alpha/beta hydrolase-fold protein [Bacteroidales bacterium]|nr:alpha/beta hydrolase-fold protein [Bacteroidales bacterium]